MTTKIDYGGILGGFYGHNNCLYFAYRRGEYVISFPVTNGVISESGVASPPPDEEVEAIFNAEWEKFGLSHEMIANRFPELGGSRR